MLPTRWKNTPWRVITGGSKQWGDVRDSGGHLDVTLRALAFTLSSRDKIVTTQVIAVGALTMGFQRMLGMVCSKDLLDGFYGCEGAATSVSALSATLALLSLLDGPWGSDPTFFIIWSRFRQLRRYLSYRPQEEDRIFRLLSCASTGSPGHGPFILLFEQAGWTRPGLHPLRMMTGPIQHFRSAIWQAWQEKVAADLCLCKREGFRGGT